LNKHYSVDRIIVSLRTKSKRIALQSSSHLSLELDSYWSSIRIKQIASSYIKHKVTSQASTSTGVTVKEALEYYLELKGPHKSKLFFQYTERSINYLCECLGDRDLSEYSTSDAGKFRDALFARGLVSSSVKRVFSSVKSIFNLIIREKGLGIKNPFSDVYMPDLDDTKSINTIPIKTIRIIQQEFLCIDDDIRRAIALISDTGMRLAEVIGLKTNDIIIDTNIPHILVRSNNKRGLKTKQSERVVPLVGLSLWSAKRLLKNIETEFLFPRYNKGNISNSNSASATFNKWIKTTAKDDIVIHSFRHSMRDRLRAVECPSDIIDSIGGWSKRSTGESYGSGHPIHILHKWMERIT
jgi:integrase